MAGSWGYFQMTELNATQVTVKSSGLAVPAPVMFDASTPSPNQPQPANEMERFEGMLVRVVNGTVSSPTNQFGEASVVATDHRAFREPGIAFPGLPSLPLPVWDGNPEIFEIDTDLYAAAPHLLIPAGATVSATGPLAFSFGDYQIWPTSLDVTGDPTLRAVRARQPGETLTVAMQNLLRGGRHARPIPALTTRSPIRRWYVAPAGRRCPRSVRGPATRARTC